jgi:hypothetical protein
VLDQGSSSAFYESLCREMYSEKFQSRKGLISPLYEVSLKSRTEISKNKLAQIQELSDSEEFRNTLNKALMFSILFQAPLYVGKSKNLRRRIGQHLSVNSVLSERLNNSGIEIASTSVLILPTSLEEQAEADDTDIGNEDYGSEEDADQSLIFEEIFSRLFSPLFTIRYG